MKKNIRDCVAAIREKTDFVPRVALTLGSGLGQYAAQVRVVCEIPYQELAPYGFPVSTAPGHEGRFIFGYVGETPVVCMKGRVHLYEGYDTEQVVMPVRVMRALGAEILFLSNASGGINPAYPVGSLVLLSDHISSFVRNPLIGPNDPEDGVRFPDMSCAYDGQLRALVKEAAKACGIDLYEGVYVQLTGPSFESPAEIRMLGRLGADMVGMSTVVEVIAARHLGMRVACVSLISNLAAGISENPLTSEEVEEAGREAEPRFSALVTRAISMMRSDAE
ncbi:MAG: purine-nucleoside phosphorylase [Eubacteriales bacterium]|nr:purine-nucleoside phosphorylase [Eubacteriales bacterium]